MLAVILLAFGRPDIHASVGEKTATVEVVPHRNGQGKTWYDRGATCSPSDGEVEVSVRWGKVSSG